MRQKIVGVMGSGSSPWTDLAAPLGRWLAEAGYHLLTGGGQGAMAAACEAFSCVSPRAGRCLGVVPTEPHDDRGFVPQQGYPNPWVEIVIVSPLGKFLPDQPAHALTRNHINVLSSDVIVALPGWVGTRNEVALALSFGKPVILFGPTAEFVDFPPQAPRTDDLDEVRDFIGRHAGA